MNLGIQARIDAWEEAGLLDAETATRLREHEAASTRPVLVPAVLGVGAVAISLGLVAIVAANWSAIGGATKLGVDLALGVVLGALIVRSSPGWRREVAVLVFYGYVLASIGLIGQVYHLSSPLWQPLLTWSVLTAPVLWLVRSGAAAGIWIAGLSVTHALVFERAFEFFERLFGSGSEGSVGVLLALVAISPFLYFGISRARGLDGEAGPAGRAFNAAGWAAVYALAFASAMLFYVDVGVDESAGLALLPAAGIWSVAAVSLPSWQAPGERPAVSALRATLIIGVVSTCAALGFARAEWALVGALGQLAVLALAAWTCQSMGMRGGFRLATAAIYLRLLIVYFEVFGSLLSTGLGLISGGALAMAFAWLWSKRSNRATDAAARASGGAP